MKTMFSINFFKRIIWILVTVLATIGLAAVARRLLLLNHLVKAFQPPGAQGFDDGFARHPFLTTVHILAGAVFMIAGPLQFIKRIRENHLSLHRWSGRIFVAASYVIGVSALIMSYTTSIGGVNETPATTAFAIIFLFALTKALIYILKRKIALHREWMIRVFAIGLAIATVRPINVLFFIFSSMTPHEFFGIAFWIGFTLHLVIAEAWIQSTRFEKTLVI